MFLHLKFINKFLFKTSLCKCKLLKFFFAVVAQKVKLLALGAEAHQKTRNVLCADIALKIGIEQILKRMFFIRARFYFGQIKTAGRYFGQRPVKRARSMRQ